MKANEITVTAVPEQERMKFMPYLFTAKCFILSEQTLFRTARKISKEYNGGHWEFAKLSNGSGFAYPESPEKFSVYVDGNGFEGELGREAFGIVCTLFALSGACAYAFMKEMTAANETLHDHYHQLRDYVAQHTEAKQIFRAID
ncbi:antirestriction protein [Burkholderia guangdongensis]|uniref:antirestriction protein n=1 Tax=Burkholderia guangdongensis TaxID=1792500 RepID=UPI0015C71E19|nr:antirestriction protein [Burkholderia guangdongensis]